MTDVSGLAPFIARTMPALAERIPAVTALLLGRLGAPTEESQRPPYPPHHGEPEIVGVLRPLGPLPPERLLGALERQITRYDWTGAPGVLTGLPKPSDYRFAFVASGGHDSEAVTAATLLERLRPGLSARVTDLVRALRSHPAITPLLETGPEARDEAAIATRHGAGHVALAVAVAGAVVHQADPPMLVSRAAAVVGLGLGAAVPLLREIPMPGAYAAALLEKVRAEYLLPRHTSGSVTVAGHRFGLVEGSLPAVGDFSGNGLAVAVEGGVAVRTGVAEGHLRVELVVAAEAPAEVEDGWEDVVELSWHAAEGQASIVSPDGTVAGRLRGQTPPWPGDYRVRVHAVDRDSGDSEFERYKLVVWAASRAPEIVHKRTDRLGYQLRGEAVPERAARPEHAYRWVRRSRLSVAATITVVTGSTVEEALRAFGADPSRPLPIDAIQRDLSLRQSIDPWVIPFDAGGAVILVEENGYFGSHPGVLSAASANGRAASMFWNVNAMTRLSFAEHGTVLASFEPFGGEQTPPAVTEALTGIDFSERGYRTEKGLAAVERFTGHGITAADVTAVFASGSGYLIEE
ncbi:DUF6461 domain-containing protein [Paractinoplanes atraurantiacus]|uniref:Uncharacterized protein n=1 Tax=Paractinoplanes atraurantiacus TaxID=1036182 RepID=A0A285K2L5_9ACTN|nr:DUF6461 domain-containing protein [Actinoplanes atraurantiacus]SNY66820.1 hypothetical protein SAMN05421748_130130 [Actinoplanes atraurantiacus]